ncbi:MAG: DUF3471 domain-containing protein [Terriglobia bacterium]
MGKAPARAAPRLEEGWHGERAKAGTDRVTGTKPSHHLVDYTGEYEHPAYGILHIELKDGILQFKFNRFLFPMSHYHYDRFDTPDGEQYGKFSVNFRTNPKGEIDEAAMSLDEAAVVFTRKPRPHWIQGCWKNFQGCT